MPRSKFIQNQRLPGAAVPTATPRSGRTGRSRHRYILPTEVIFLHISALGVLASFLWVPLTFAQWLLVLLYVDVSLFIYWSIRVYLRDTGVFSRWWSDQVAPAHIFRTSLGIVIILLELSHFLMFLANLLVISANILFIVHRDLVTDWTHATCLTLNAAGVNINCSPTPNTILFQALSVFDALIGVTLFSLWVSAFVSAFETMFRPFKTK